MAETADNIVETRGLTKVFRDFWMREKVTAVADVDLVAHRKEVFGLLGPNGSGKSTTIKMILGLLFPTRGQVAVMGRLPTDVAIKARIGFLPEESYLYPFLDARETLDFYGKLFHQDRRERRRRIDMLLEMVGLSSVAFRRVGEYSKGMQRRIGLAQALINDPDLLILDEPTSGMDPIGTRQFKELIRTLAQRGKTIILSSHLLADVEDVCDRVAVLYGGRLRAQGTVGELLAQSNLTSITTEHLDERTIEKVRQLIAQSGRERFEVATPRDRLENLFIKIVQEAQSQRLRTGGATSGGQVAEFLRQGPDDGQQGRQIIEELVQSAPAADGQAHVQDQQAQQPAAASKADESVLHELVGKASGDEQAKAQPPAKSGGSSAADDAKTPAAPKKQDQADRGVLDDLMGG